MELAAERIRGPGLVPQHPLLHEITQGGYLPRYAKVQGEVYDARLQPGSEPRRRQHVSDRLCADGTDRSRRGKNRNAS